MFGVRVFNTLQEALREGYHVYDRTQDGYVVRIRVQDKGEWALAFVRLTGIA
jgi:hypothetical protein